jgi:uncharacterized protein (DUF885 family)
VATTDIAPALDVFVHELLALDPVGATAAGLHAHDGRWPDMTDAGRAGRVAFLDRWEETLRAVSSTSLDPDGRVDRELVLDEIAARRFEETDLREDRWDPLAWVYLMGAGIFPLLARDFTPIADRLASLAGRFEGLDTLLDAAEVSLSGTPERPVSRLHAEVALRQLPGIADLVDEAGRAAGDAADDPAVAAVLPRLGVAAARARARLERFRAHLEDAVLPASDGEGRLGADLYARKLRHTFRSGITPEAIRERATGEFAAVRAEMIRLAREAWPAWVPDRPLPDAAGPGADVETVRTVLDAVGAAHPSGEAILGFCRTELVSIEEFVRAHDLVGLPADPLAIEWTPRFLRSLAGAMFDAPGPLDVGQRSFYYITPVPDDWTPEQVDSYLREHNERMLRLITVHEAIPGHYLQLMAAIRCPSLPRAVLASGVFAEGWAVYITQVMVDTGYGAHDPALLLSHWKYYLRAVANALLDLGVHADGMSRDEAMRLMVDGAFQEESEAVRKWDRARLSSTQLSTYFVGSAEMWDLEQEVRRRRAVASDDPRGAEAVPVPRVVGDLGDTPGFVYREHLEEVLRHGTPPIPLLRRLVLGEA